MRHVPSPGGAQRGRGGRYRSGMLVVALLALLAACGGGERRVTGTVVAVDGDLTTVTSFDLQTDGGRMRFVPGPGLDGFVDADGRFDAPLSHLWEHLRDGAPVRVTFRVEQASNVATMLEDVP